MDKRAAQRDARRAFDEGRHAEGIGLLWPLVEAAHIADQELGQHLAAMGHGYAQMGLRRASCAIALFLGDHRTAHQYAEGEPLDLARCAQQRGDHRRAAEAYEEAGWLGHAAIQLEEAKNLPAARVLWEQLADDPALAEHPYVGGLVRFNLARVCAELDDKQAARRASIQSMHLLEAAADGFETRGLRERAFDCYQVIMTMGKEGSFENLAEGYLNCIRVLREDNLRYYVLQYYEDFQALALERKELHAAATLFREAADYARRQGLPYGRTYRLRGGETHLAAAERTLTEGGSPELAENAYAAAIDAFNELGLYSRVREVYGRLAELPLSERRRERYLRLQERLASMKDDERPMDAFPDYLRMDTAYPEIWRLDVIEWEQGGDPADTMIEVVLDPKWASFTRRRALLCCLAQLGSGEGQLREPTLESLAGLLGRVEIYAALAPLETLFRDVESARVRAACLRALRQLFFKRSFELVMEGLRDGERSVRQEALAAVASLHFGHAFDPLSRIYRDTSEAEVRRTALASIGKIQSVQAVELLIDVLRHGDSAERDLARDLLASSQLTEATSLIQRAAAEESGPVRAELDRVLGLRGAR